MISDSIPAFDRSPITLSGPRGRVSHNKHQNERDNTMKATTNATSTSPLHVRFLTLLLAAAVLVVAPQSSWATGGVPFKGRAAGAITSVSPDPDGVVMTVSAEGDATLLGRFTREEVLLLNPSTGTFTGSIVFTAANGDQLVASVAGGFVSPTTAAGTYTFSGGTGRFKNATGGAEFVASTPDGTHLTVEFSGVVDWAIAR